MPMHPVRQDFPGALYSTPTRASDWHARGLPPVGFMARMIWHILRAAAELDGGAVRIKDLNAWMHQDGEGPAPDHRKTLRKHLKALEQAGLAARVGRQWAAVMPEDRAQVENGAYAPQTAQIEPETGRLPRIEAAEPAPEHHGAYAPEKGAMTPKNGAIAPPCSGLKKGQSPRKTGQSPREKGQSPRCHIRNREERRETSSSAPEREALPEQPERTEPRGDDALTSKKPQRQPSALVTRPARWGEWEPLEHWGRAHDHHGLRPDEVPDEERAYRLWLDLAASTATWHQIHSPRRQEPIENRTGYRAEIRRQFDDSPTAALEAVEAALTFARQRRARMAKQERQEARRVAEVERARERALTDQDRDYDPQAGPVEWLQACRPDLLRRLRQATARDPHLFGQWERQAREQWKRGDGSRLAVIAIREAVLHRLFMVLAKCEEPRREGAA